MVTYICPVTGEKAQLVHVESVYSEYACSECDWCVIGASVVDPTDAVRERHAANSEVLSPELTEADVGASESVVEQSSDSTENTEDSPVSAQQTPQR